MENLTTTIEWHLAEKELPEKSGDYLVISPSSAIGDIYFSKKHNRFNIRDWMREDFMEPYPVAFWAEIPECFSWENLAKFREE